MAIPTDAHDETVAMRPNLESMIGSLRLFALRSAVTSLLGWMFVLTSIAEARAQESIETTEAEAADRLFTLNILPVLRNKCFGCHGSDPDDIRGEYDLTTRERMLAGGESGSPSLEPGNPEESALYRAILWQDYEMPPKENDRLSNIEIEHFRKWIEAGAPWPDEASQNAIRQSEWEIEINDAGKRVRTSGGTSDDWTNRRYAPEDLWAFEPVRTKSELLPGLDDTTQAIDRMIDHRLHEAGLSTAEVASPRTLIRRATFDLTGLPPTPEEIDQFLSAWSIDSQQAWSDLIDRLLESKSYGEHWGRHWLDVTRYADTGGMSNDFERSNMWRYRDYVIRSFNDDKPYDQFVIEQLAGDELADQSVLSRISGNPADAHQVQLTGDYTPQESEWIVATGFLRLGPWDNAMIDSDEARQIYLDDLVNITSQTFLAQTLRCCKCHDHKFDPIPTRDYYRMYAAFSATHMAERPAPFLSQENVEGFSEGEAHVRRMLDFAVTEKDRLIAKREAAARQWFDERGLPYKDEQQRVNLPDEEKPARHVGLSHAEQGQLKVREQDEWIWTRRLERFQPMVQSVFNAPTAPLAWNGARKLRIDRSWSNKPEPPNHILLGGNLTAWGDPVKPGVLSALGLEVDATADDPYLLPEKTDGRRLALARWIANPKNGLTTRAIVNRIWQYHFGAGLATNPNNFGAKGARPSHPELLDWLAADFVEHDWRIKRLHRAIMMSQAYRRTSIPVNQDQLDKLDPNNRLLSHFPRRRLSAEELRDGFLAITGELQDSSGGLPIKPEINQEVALQPRMLQFSLAPAYQPSPTPQQRNRRSVYAYVVRGQADPFCELFNQPNPNESCEQRESSAVTPQVFTLLNSEMMTDRSIALAQRLQQDRDSLHDQIDWAFQLVLGRPGSPSELESMLSYVTDMRSYHSQIEPAPTVYPKRITRSLVEEFSGERFEYEEILPTYENYEPDLKPADVSPTTRALSDMCLLLFNTNEFVYID